MQKTHRIIRHTTRNVGEPSSKYAYDRDGKQFEADIKEHKERSDFLWSEFVQFMRDHQTTPEEFRGMFARYYEEFLT
jgi:hypothetical protein